MASTKREPPPGDSDEREAKKAKASVSDSSEPAKIRQRVVLNPADCDLDFNIEGNGLHGSALHDQGFAYCWSGSRANVGITGGKYCFGCRIISAQPVDMADTPPEQQHVCRLGISRGDDSVGNLGETEHSFGFGGTGKFSTAGKFSNYGEKFGVGDTIVCAVNLEHKPLASISFFKNGKCLGTAKHFSAGLDGLGVVDCPIRKLQWESALFPHVLLKNVVVEVQFSVEDGLIPEEGYKPWASALEDGNAIMGPTFSDPRDCELMMMVGLPASGKTTWAEKWVKEHPEKRYVLLGTNLALDLMKVPGLLRKHNYGERFDRLMDRATGIFNTLLSRASKTPRNYIIDQTNVYKSARKRKLKPFASYRKVAVVVFPRPEELKSRADGRFKSMGKEVPAEALNEMLANYVLPISKDMPGADEYFDQVIFTELNRNESQRCLDEMKHALPLGGNTPTKSVSPYSHDSSSQSYYSSPLQMHETLSGDGRHSYSTQAQLNYDYQRADLINSAHFGGRVPGRMDSFSLDWQGGQTARVPYGSYDRMQSTGVVANSYSTYGRSGSYSHPNLENRNFIPGGATGHYQSGTVEPYMRSSYSTHGEQTGFLGPRGSQATSGYLPLLPSSPATYGSPHETPRPPYGSPSGDMRPARGFGPRHPGYY
ncbi:uncharacterized protein LOC127808873 isoform X2 [Diospyros lotus]|uniref:uncharacterized protein LOC127808873 isoform X2 n=1 Tax=Diospyros lotus TaxID=55363 RepID=UPI002258FD90|nr:uncharacterized protein LOC127808873 isoform X2 [Diospyros lotus]